MTTIGFDVFQVVSFTLVSSLFVYMLLSLINWLIEKSIPRKPMSGIIK